MTSQKNRKVVADLVKPTGEVVAMVSPFGGPPDLQGDVIDEGAYTSDIIYWNQSQNRLPVLISHDWKDESANIGYVERLEAVPGYGLVATMRLDLSNPRAAYVHKLLYERRMVEFSIGFDSLDEERQRDGSTLLRRLHLHEISVVLRGAAASREEPFARTELLMVKNSTGTAGSTSTTWTATALADRLVAVAAGSGITDAKRLGRLRSVVEAHTLRPDNTWLLQENLKMLVDDWSEKRDPVIESLNDRLDAIEHGQRPRDADAMVDAFITAVRLELVEEKLAEARASSVDAELNERAAHTSPVPEFDERFTVRSVPTEYESGDTEQVQVVGYQSETFRIAVLPGTMRPDNE